MNEVIFGGKLKSLAGYGSGSGSGDGDGSGSGYGSGYGSGDGDKTQWPLAGAEIIDE